ncbi:MAG TPA: prepilin-type N-terminal cleavage/methylation domain-containing protein [Candidatus Hydrothermia bacterium]|nr:prepilin-type N-terminal cleavage/methylation domain-containing protein [Candidatus Hydrothermia bacterium]MDD5572748.1 prepilin-type N-terminal cleavage/methylation domain-containing protein [Candidatus Hydrothermia bacterium]HOK23131.1 prepilin-type N-terminal cleavage/methylation domain-containing protein [Candidatus Hydrothermia bacterium]HOL23835.1 prepilin-type N-terminal cleavage/methylation domain-containing protein [Candidatus Hydrothermia bacterium]HPO78840.1 prepilin-type N-termin
MKKRKGVTLIEVIVAFAILSALLASVFVVYRSQLRTASTQQSLSILQTDIQQAFNIMKWDVLMAGYGTPASIVPITGVNGDDGSDVLNLSSTGFIVGGSTRWSYTLDIFAADQIIVRRWDDERVDLHLGDSIIIMDDKKNLITPDPLEIKGREVLIYNNLPAYRLSLSAGVQTAPGNFVYTIPAGHVAQVAYTLQNDTLFRGNEPFLSGVEDFQLAYWVDLDRDGIEDSGERVWDPQEIAEFPSVLKTVRPTIVLAGDVDRDYTFPETQITVEDHTYELDTEARMRRRRFYTIDIKVRNVR